MSSDDKKLIDAAAQVLAAARVYADTRREIEAKKQPRPAKRASKGDASRAK